MTQKCKSEEENKEKAMEGNKIFISCFLGVQIIWGCLPDHDETGRVNIFQSTFFVFFFKLLSFLCFHFKMQQYFVWIIFLLALKMKRRKNSFAMIKSFHSFYSIEHSPPPMILTIQTLNENLCE